MLNIHLFGNMRCNNHSHLNALNFKYAPTINVINDKCNLNLSLYYNAHWCIIYLNDHLAQKLFKFNIEKLILIEIWFYLT